MENTNKDKYRPVILVSKDTAVRIKAESVGLYAEDYKNDKTAIFQRYGNVLNSNDYHNGILSVRYNQTGEDIYRLQGEDKQSKVKRGKSLENIIPKNIEQECAIDALTNPNIEIVALTGSAGTGKTVLALAAGIHQTTKKSPLYEQVLVARPVVPMGNDLGYLPGDIDDKLAPWMQPIFDNLKVIVNTPAGQFKDNTTISKYKKLPVSDRFRYFKYRGAHIHQGQEPSEKIFHNRRGAKSKAARYKDHYYQMWGRHKNSVHRGFKPDRHALPRCHEQRASYLISRFINEENFCYLNLKSSVRSRLAEQGARLLQSFSASINVSRYMKE